MMTIERLKQDGDALVVLFKRYTNVIDYLFILLKTASVFIYRLIFVCVIVAGTWPAPLSCFTGALYECSKLICCNGAKYFLLRVPTSVFEFPTDT